MTRWVLPTFRSAPWPQVGFETSATRPQRPPAAAAAWPPRSPAEQSWCAPRFRPRWLEGCTPLWYSGSHSSPGICGGGKRYSSEGSGCHPCAAVARRGTRCSSWHPVPCTPHSSRGIVYSVTLLPLHLCTPLQDILRYTFLPEGCSSTHRISNPMAPFLYICHKLGGTSHRSVRVDLCSSALGRCGDTVPWSVEERKTCRKTGSLWAVGPGMPCSSCHTSHTDHWCFLHSIRPCIAASTLCPAGTSQVGRSGTACCVVLHRSCRSCGRAHTGGCPCQCGILPGSFSHRSC